MLCCGRTRCRVRSRGRSGLKNHLILLTWILPSGPQSCILGGVLRTHRSIENLPLTSRPSLQGTLLLSCRPQISERGIMCPTGKLGNKCGYILPYANMQRALAINPKYRAAPLTSQPDFPRGMNSRSVVVHISDFESRKRRCN